MGLQGRLTGGSLLRAPLQPHPLLFQTAERSQSPGSTLEGQPSHIGGFDAKRLARSNIGMVSPHLILLDDLSGTTS